MSTVAHRWRWNWATVVTATSTYRAYGLRVDGDDAWIVDRRGHVVAHMTGVDVSRVGESNVQRLAGTVDSEPAVWRATELRCGCGGSRMFATPEAEVPS